METTLHQQLKQLYAGADARLEVRVGKYRVDVVTDSELVEVQRGPLVRIRDKVRTLLADNRVLLVKPIVARRQLVKLARKGGREIGRRMSPKRGRLVDVFDELVYFTSVFPHRRLTVEVPLLQIEQWRYPARGYNRRGYRVADERLVKVSEVHRFRTAADLLELLPHDLPREFHTGHLADSLGVNRWAAQRVAYCLRRADAIRRVGKEGRSYVYVRHMIRRPRNPRAA